LQAKIAIIESEFLPAVRAAAADARRPAQGAQSGSPPPDVGASEPVPPAGAAPQVGPAEPGAGTGGAAPSVESPVSRAAAGPAASWPAAPEPVVADAGEAPGSGVSPEVDIGRERRPPAAGSPALEQVEPDRNDVRVRAARRSYGSLLLVATCLSAVAIGGWWAYRTGLFGLPEDSGSVPNPPQIVEEEDFSPGGEIVPPPVTGEAAPRDWVNVFSPADASGVNSPAGATAETMEDESGTFLRVRSGGNSVIFDVGQGVLEQMAGQKAVFDISARAAEGQETQISVECDFGELGDCGRKRYEVGYERGEYLFEIDLPDIRPGAAGSIAVNSDFDGQDRAVDIY